MMISLVWTSFSAIKHLFQLDVSHFNQSLTFDSEEFHVLQRSEMVTFLTNTERKYIKQSALLHTLILEAGYRYDFSPRYF